ncbi:MAG: nucleotidyltransferase domain-containing protein [Methanobrevibacter sp.]|nr:nucleotidyltransferase domain-containing protein [Methanobrevibacter sp.]
MDKKQIALQFAKSLKLQEIEKIILFGSVAREDDDADSDIDILIITNNKDEIEDDVSDKSFDFLLKTREYISPVIISTEYYKKFKNFSFFKTVKKEGIQIG